MKYVVFVFVLVLGGINLNAQKNCQVLDSNIAGEYDGKCRKGFAHGKGTAKGEDTYKGRFKNGMKHNQGTYTWANGDVYTGEFENDLMHGKGKLVQKEPKKTVEGYWKNGEYVGDNIEDFQGYKIIANTNVPNPIFTRLGEGKEIQFEIRDINNSITSFKIINYSSGKIRTINNSSGEVTADMIGVEFPINLTFSYRVANKSNNFMVDSSLMIEISDPGKWKISISHN